MNSVDITAIVLLTICFTLLIFGLIQVKYQNIIDKNYDEIEKKLAKKGVIIVRAGLGGDGDAYRFKLDVGSDETTTSRFLPWKTYKILRKMEKDGAWGVTCSLLPKKKDGKVRKQSEFHFNPK